MHPMVSRSRALLAAAAVLGAAACGGRARDRAAHADTATLPSVAAAAPAMPSVPAVTVSAPVRDSAAGQVASPSPRGAPPRATRPAPSPSPAPPIAAPATAATPQAGAPPRRVTIGGLDLTGVGYDVGDAAAPVVVVDFSDFGCPYCGQFTRETYPALEREYVRTGKVLFKYVPFVAGMFPNGQQAARAAECAADQGRFWPMHDSLYAQQAEWKKALMPSGVFQRDVAALGLDRARFDACYATQEVHARTRRANGIADRIGVRVTPSFVVDGRPVEGALPIADFRRVLDAALLAKARK